MSILDALAVMATRLDTIVAFTTVVDEITELDPSDSALPGIWMKVNAPTQGLDEELGHMDRPTLIWPIDLYCLCTVRSKDIAVDLAVAIPLLEAVHDSLISNLTLSGELDGVITFGNPICDGPGTIPWKDKTYTGFVLHARLPLKSASAYSN